MNLADLIKYTKLQAEGIKQYERKMLDIGQQIVARMKIQKEKFPNRYYSYPFKDLNGEITLEVNNDMVIVHINWEEYWNYGGHESGVISFDIKYLEDQQALDTYLNSI